MRLFDGIDLGDDEEVVRSPVNPRYDNPDPEDDDDDDDSCESIDELDKEKKKEEIRKLRIDNESKLNNLVSKDLVTAMLGEIGHSMQTNFVDLARRESPTLAAELGIANLERDLEKKLSDLIKIGIESVVDNISKLCKDEVFE